MKDTYGYTVARKGDDSIMDDAVDDKEGKDLYVYPVFKKREHCLKYAQDTYNHNVGLYGKLRWYQMLKIVKVSIKIV